jgi:hypothetical protein
MAYSGNKWYAQQYQDAVMQLAQQQGSKMRPIVFTKTVDSEKVNFERLGETAAVAKTTRYTDTPNVEMVHSRRVATLSDYHWATMHDWTDGVRMLVDPKGAYTKAGAWAMGRAIDDLIIAAALGNATDDAGSSVALPAGQKIAEAGTAGMTLAKILEAKRILDAAEVENEDRYFVLGSQQLEDLLNVTEIKSADYNSVKALVEGQIDSYLGFKFIRSERLSIASSKRKCIAFQKSGLGLGIGKDMTTKIDERPDKSYGWQVYMAWSMCSTRVEDERVVEVQAHEA